MKVSPHHFWPYGRYSKPNVGDVIPVRLRDGTRALAQVRFWNRFGIWLRSRRDGAFMWLSLRANDGDYAPEHQYAQFW